MPIDSPGEESYSPWTVVHLVFDHLVDNGLHPTLGEAGDPSAPAAALLQAMGVRATTRSDMRMPDEVHEELAALREAIFDEP